MASFKEGQTKNVICKGQWFTLIYMTAVKNIHFTKKAFLYIFFSTFIELVLNYIVQLFSHQCLATKRTLHFVAFVSSARCKIVASEVRARVEGKISKTFWKWYSSPWSFLISFDSPLLFFCFSYLIFLFSWVSSEVHFSWKSFRESF